MFIKIYKAIVLPDDTLELLETPSQLQTGHATSIGVVENVRQYIKCSGDGIFRFKKPPYYIMSPYFSVSQSVTKQAIEFIGFYQNKFETDLNNPTDYLFPIGGDWVYEENNEYKYQELATSIEVAEPVEIIMNGGLN